jgi:hypothetical protein
LTGKDVADLLEGKAISAFGTEFVYDGTSVERVQDAITRLGGPRVVIEPRGDSVASIMKNVASNAAPNVAQKPRNPAFVRRDAQR